LTIEIFCRSGINVSIECVELAVGRGALTDEGFVFNQKRPVIVVKLLKQSVS